MRTIPLTYSSKSYSLEHIELRAKVLEWCKIKLVFYKKELIDKFPDDRIITDVLVRLKKENTIRCCGRKGAERQYMYNL